MAGEMAVPWARADTMYGIVCEDVWAAVRQSCSNCFKSFREVKPNGNRKAPPVAPS